MDAVHSIVLEAIELATKRHRDLESRTLSVVAHVREFIAMDETCSNAFPSLVYSALQDAVDDPELDPAEFLSYSVLRFIGSTPSIEPSE